MKREELFSTWAPADSPWSPWVMPVAFAHIPEEFSVHGPGASPWSPSISPELALQLRESAAQSLNRLSLPEIDWAIAEPTASTALVLDLPGDKSLAFAAAAISRGFRPVPVIASAAGPTEPSIAYVSEGTAQMVAVPMGPVVRALLDVTPLLTAASLSPNAPPAFVLDARRMMPNVAVTAEVFDNRSKIFPEDFPSARFLRERGIARVLLVQQGHSTQPQEDLSHVLLRWQDAGLEILAADADRQIPPAPITVARPSRYRALWYRALAMLGLRRNRAGGFGGFQGEWSGAG